MRLITLILLIGTGVVDRCVIHKAIPIETIEFQQQAIASLNIMRDWVDLIQCDEATAFQATQAAKEVQTFRGLFIDLIHTSEVEEVQTIVWEHDEFENDYQFEIFKKLGTLNESCSLQERGEILAIIDQLITWNQDQLDQLTNI